MSYFNALAKRLKSLFTPKKAEGSKRKASYGPSPIFNAQKNFLKYADLQEAHRKNYYYQSTKTYSTPLDDTGRDEAAEVYLDENGEIITPLTCGTAFDYCPIDRWYMPDCVPGIISTVDITYVDPPSSAGYYLKGGPRRLIRVLFANDKYIELPSEWVKQSRGRCAVYIEPNDMYYQTVVAHFANRGLEFIRDGVDLNKLSQTYGTFNGQRNQKAGVTSTGKSGGKPSNPQISVDWGSGQDYTCWTVTCTKTIRSLRP